MLQLLLFKYQAKLLIDISKILVVRSNIPSIAPVHPDDTGQSAEQCVLKPQKPLKNQESFTWLQHSTDTNLK